MKTKKSKYGNKFKGLSLKLKQYQQKDYPKAQ